MIIPLLITLLYFTIFVFTTDNVLFHTDHTLTTIYYRLFVITPEPGEL